MDVIFPLSLKGSNFTWISYPGSHSGMFSNRRVQKVQRERVTSYGRVIGQRKETVLVFGSLIENRGINQRLFTSDTFNNAVLCR